MLRSENISDDLFVDIAVNADECFLTRMQEMSLDFQFVIEQEGGSSIHAFFSFNGNIKLSGQLCKSLIQPV